MCCLARRCRAAPGWRGGREEPLNGGARQCPRPRGLGRAYGRRRAGDGGGVDRGIAVRGDPGPDVLDGVGADDAADVRPRHRARDCAAARCVLRRHDGRRCFRGASWNPGDAISRGDGVRWLPDGAQGRGEPRSWSLRHRFRIRRSVQPGRHDAAHRAGRGHGDPVRTRGDLRAGAVRPGDHLRSGGEVAAARPRGRRAGADADDRRSRRNRRSGQADVRHRRASAGREHARRDDWPLRRPAGDRHLHGPRATRARAGQRGGAGACCRGASCGATGG